MTLSILQWGPSADPGDRDLSKFLKLVGPTLEKFVVNERSSSFHDHDLPNPKAFQNLPQMRNLKDLSLYNYEVTPEEGPEFLKKFPSLRMVRIRGIGDHHQFFERCSQAGVIHNNQEKINFIETTDFQQGLNIGTPATMHFLSQVFSKLSKARLGFPETPADASVDEVKLWMEKVFHEIGHMKNLKDLYISFGLHHNFEPQVNESEDVLDLTTAFRNLKELPSKLIISKTFNSLAK